MDKIDTLIDTLIKIYSLLAEHYKKNSGLDTAYLEEELMSRQQVKDYLGISESTYRRKVRDGSIRPIKMPGGERCYKSELLSSFLESRRRGRV